MKKLRFFLRLMSVKEIDIWVKEIDTEIHRLEKSSVTILSCMDKLVPLYVWHDKLVDRRKELVKKASVAAR